MILFHAIGLAVALLAYALIACWCSSYAVLWAIFPVLVALVMIGRITNLSGGPRSQ